MQGESFAPEARKPRLIWSGKSRRKAAEALPTQVVEVVYPQHADVRSVGAWQEMGRAQAEQGRLPGMRVPVQARLGGAATGEPLPPNRLIWTNDNLTALTALLHGDDQHEPLEGKVDLIYIDPPFAVQNDFRMPIEIEDGATDEKLPTLIEELAYTDTWKDGLDSYLSMMRDRLEYLKAMLAPSGSIYVHCDPTASHYLKVVLDEIFGIDKFRNEVVWKRTYAHGSATRWGDVHDTILFYTKSETYTWNRALQAHGESYLESKYRYQDARGRYRWVVLTAPGISKGPSGAEWRGYNPTLAGRHWATPQKALAILAEEGFTIPTELHAQLDLLLQHGLIRMSDKDAGATGAPEYKLYLEKGSPVQDIVTDIPPVNSQARERLNFPTQKPIALLQRVIAASSSPGDLVLDAFAGSGTTAVAAETMKDADGKPAPRRWIAIDCGKFAVHITRKRLIEAGARPFAVENVGFYARGKEWRDLWAERPEAKVYRDAMVTIYGGTPVAGYAHLHGRKGSHWVHVGPLDAPVAMGQVDAILNEAAATEIKAVDILSADIPIDFNKTEAEERHGVRLFAKVIPAAAVEAVRERLKRKRRRDAALEIEEGPPVHFFSPPDVEVGVSVSGDSVTVKLLRLTVDLEDCLGTQDPAKRAQIIARITDWRALVDYWAVDWDFVPGEPFRNDWQSFRTRKNRHIAMQAANSYGGGRGEKLIAVKVTDVFGNDGLKVARVVVGSVTEVG